MRSTLAMRARRALSGLFALALTFGLVPAAAFAQLAEAQNAGAADAADAAFESEDLTSEISEGEQSPYEVIMDGEGDAPAFEESSDAEGHVGESGSQGANAETPVIDTINQEVALDTLVAQAESTRTFFLAQTLESTHTIPVVAASLPLDSSAVEDNAATESEEGSTSPARDEATDIALDSVVVGSFTQGGLTYAMEPGGETVALVAVDQGKLNEEWVEARVIIIPAAVTPDEDAICPVTRIADNAFASVGGSEPSEEALSASEEDEGDSDGSIIAVSVPASVTSIEQDAFTGFSTLQFIAVDEANSEYASYDGCLYDASLSRLLLIPGER